MFFQSSINTAMKFIFDAAVDANTSFIHDIIVNLNIDAATNFQLTVAKFTTDAVADLISPLMSISTVILLQI